MHKYITNQYLIAIFAMALVSPLVCVAGSETKLTSPATAPTTQPTLLLKDLDGAARNPLVADPGMRGTVVIFIAAQCPISNGYAPEINHISQEYGEEGQARFTFYLVYPDPDLTIDQAKAHAAEFGYTCLILRDTQRKLVARLGAKVTPEAFVLDPTGSVLYHGRIDDKYVAFGRSRPEPTIHDLRNALEAIRAGRPAPVITSPAVGCPIEG